MNDGTTLLDGYIGSPLYGISPDHGLAILLVIGLGIAALAVRWFAGRGGERSSTLMERYRGLPSLHRLLAWTLGVSAAMNVGMGIGGSNPAVGAWLFGIAAAETAVLVRLLTARTWRTLATVTLVVALTINLGLSVAGFTVGQLGMIAALIQATGLAVVLRTAEGGRLLRTAASLTVIGAIGFTTLAGWGGAVVAGIGGETIGETPLPGVLLPVGTNRPPTADEKRLADEFHKETIAAIAKYEDISVAAADGYNVVSIVGSEYHAENDTYKSDGIVLDPNRPETLVYEPTPNGPVLLGAMYEMESIGERGPMFAGPITVWHAHDHICFGSVPLSITGFESPLGSCPLLSFSLPVTNEMMHVWTLPGVDEPYSELDDGWLEDYLANEQGS